MFDELKPKPEQQQKHNSHIFQQMENKLDQLLAKKNENQKSKMLFVRNNKTTAKAKYVLHK